MQVLELSQISALNRLMAEAPGDGYGTQMESILEGNQGGQIFVDSVLGLDTNNGASWATPLKTITKALSIAVQFNTIFIRGTFTEAVSSSLKDIAIIGAGPTQNDNVWMESAPGQTLLTLTGTGWMLSNIKFRVPTTNGIAISGTGANFTVIINCLFQGRSGSYQAINWVSGDDVQIIGCKFVYLNTTTYGAAILFSGTSANVPSGWLITGCTFAHNLRHIVCTMRQSEIFANVFQSIGLASDNVSALTATASLDLSGAGGQFNTVTQNNFGGTYSVAGGYKSSALSDDWHNNYGPSGLTTVVPA